MTSNERRQHRILIGPFLGAGLSDYMTGAFDNFDTLTFGQWQGADIHLPGLPTLDQLLKSLPADWRPDLFLLWRPEYGYIPPGLEDAPFATAALTSDWYLAFSECLEAAWRIDTLITGTRGQRVFAAAGFENVLARPMLGYQPEVDGQFSLPSDQRDIDVFCGGNPNWVIHQERALVHAELKKLPKEIRLREGPFVGREEFNRLMGRSRIFVNQTVIGEVNMKVYEAAASGTCLFVEEDNLDIRNYLEPDESVVLFNRNNLQEKVLYYLEHEVEREAIAAKARLRMAPYSYGRNMQSIVNELVGSEGIIKVKGKRPVEELNHQDRAEGLAGYSLRRNGGDPQAAVNLCSRLESGPKAGLLQAAARYLARVANPDPDHAEDGPIIEGFRAAFAAAPEYLPAAFSWARIAAAHLEPDSALAALEPVVQLLSSGCPIPYSCADFYALDRDARFDFERTAWEAIEAGLSPDQALRPLLLEDLLLVKSKLATTAGHAMLSQQTLATARKIRPESWRT